MSEIVVTRGLPASGKSTFVEEIIRKAGDSTIRVERDLLRDQLFGTRYGLSNDQENLITDMQQAMADAALKHNKTVYISDMNLRASYVRQWAKFAAQRGAKFSIEVFDELSLDELIQRDANRQHSVGENVIRNLWTKFTKNGKIAPVDITKEVSESLVIEPYENAMGWNIPEAVIVDIDGTMAKMKNRSPYEWMRVGEDEPVQAVIDAVKAAHAYGARIIFMSGRDASCRLITAKWLKQHVGPDMPFKLFMRAEGDNRKDDLVKYELFNENVRDKYHIKYVLDDRRQVVVMWRALGLSCFQVADGDF